MPDKPPVPEGHLQSSVSCNSFHEENKSEAAL
jgi:hypothetical protein